MYPNNNQRDTGNRLNSNRDTGNRLNSSRDTGNRLNSSRDDAHLRENTPGVSGNDPDGATPEINSGNQQAPDRQPQHSDGFTMIPPNESRRSKIKMMAQKEIEDLQRWKEANRPSAVHENPERLGGNMTMAEARQRQQTDSRCAKLQKKLKKEELDKRRRQEEEEELQKMKTEQRERAERLEEKQRQDEQRRREHLRQDHLRATQSFMQRFERTAPGPLASSSATHTSSRSEAVVTKGLKSARDVELEHRRVNSAFLDKLEGLGGGSETERKDEVTQEAEYPRFASEVFTHRPSNPGQQAPLTHQGPDPGQSCSDWTEEADMDSDYDWALMKLINAFPDCSRVFLEDILDQCDNDYEKAFTLLISTLS